MDNDALIDAARRAIEGEDAYVETTVVVTRGGERIDVRIQDRGTRATEGGERYTVTIRHASGHGEGQGAFPYDAIDAAWDSVRGHFDR